MNIQGRFVESLVHGYKIPRVIIRILWTSSTNRFGILWRIVMIKVLSALDGARFAVISAGIATTILLCSCIRSQTPSANALVQQVRAVLTCAPHDELLSTIRSASDHSIIKVFAGGHWPELRLEHVWVKGEVLFLREFSDQTGWTPILSVREPTIVGAFMDLLRLAEIEYERRSDAGTAHTNEGRESFACLYLGELGAWMTARRCIDAETISSLLAAIESGNEGSVDPAMSEEDYYNMIRGELAHAVRDIVQNPSDQLCSSTVFTLELLLRGMRAYANTLQTGQ